MAVTGDIDGGDFSYSGYPVVILPTAGDVWITGSSIPHIIRWDTNGFEDSNFAISIHIWKINSDSWKTGDATYVHQASVSILQEIGSAQVNLPDALVVDGKNSYFLELRDSTPNKSPLRASNFSSLFAIQSGYHYENISHICCSTDLVPVNTYATCLRAEAGEYANPLARNSSWGDVLERTLNTCQLGAFNPAASWSRYDCSMDSKGCRNFWVWLSANKGRPGSGKPIHDCTALKSSYPQPPADNPSTISAPPQWSMSYSEDSSLAGCAATGRLDYAVQMNACSTPSPEILCGITRSPFKLPTRTPTKSPTARPSSQPSRQPSAQPSTLRENPQFQIPIIIEKMRQLIGQCDSLVVDLTGSKGSGGYPWKNISFTVKGTDSNSSSAVQRFLNSERWKLFPPEGGAIPHVFFVSGARYNILAKMCNVYGGCAAKQLNPVAVTNSTNTVPVVSIFGNETRVIKPMSKLRLDGKASLTGCQGPIPLSELDFSWTMRDLSNKTSVPVLIQPIDANTPMSIFLPMFSLSAGHSYTFILKVTPRSTKVSASKKALVFVEHAVLIADIRGGIKQTAQVKQDIVLDASTSTDLDMKPSMISEKKYFKYSWSCVQLVPPAASCSDNIVFKSGVGTKTLMITSSETSFNTTSRITLELSDSRFPARQKSSAFVDLTIVDSSSPKVEITSMISSLRSVNIGRSLVIESTITTLSPCLASWSVNDANLEATLPQLALTPWQQNIRAGNTWPVNLVLPAFSFKQDTSTLTFSVSCKQTSASAIVTINQPPQPGAFSISPATGTELSTVFTLSCLDWSDSELPITYQFGISQQSGAVVLVIQRRSEASYYTAQLPSGKPDEFNLACMLQVFDNLDAVSSKVLSVVVQQAKAEDIQNLLQDALRRPANQTISKQEFATLSTIINNQLNCSSTPASVCQKLNRGPCAAVENTCGECLIGFVGDIGNSNSACMTRGAYKEMLVAQRITADSADKSKCSLADNVSCGGNPQLRCDFSTGSCVARPKTCPGDCSGHGSCIMRDASTYQELELGGSRSCSMGDTSCEATCNCDSGFSGPSCSLTAAGLVEKQKLREDLFAGLTEMANVEKDDSLESVMTLASSINSLTQVPYELSSSAVEMANAANEVVLNKLGNFDSVPIEVYTSIAASLDNSIVAMLSSSSSGGDDSAISDTGTKTAKSYRVNNATSNAKNIANKQVGLINKLADTVAGSMVYNQDAVEFVNTAFRLSIAATAISDAFTLAVPKSEIEKMDNKLFSDTLTILKGNSAGNGTISNARITLTSMKAKSMLGNIASASGILGNVLGVKIDVSGGGLTEAILTIPNHETASLPETFLTHCDARNINKTVTYSCSDSGKIIFHTCSKFGSLTSQCPVQYVRCALVSSSGVLDTSSSKIATTQSNDNNTICNYQIDSLQTLPLRQRFLSSSISSVFITTVAAFDNPKSAVFIDLNTVSSQMPSLAPSNGNQASSTTKATGNSRMMTIIIIATVVVVLIIAALGFFYYFCRKSSTHVHPIKDRTKK